MDTVRQKILDNIYTELMYIQTANGYNTNLQEVKKGLIPKGVINNFPTATISFGVDVNQDQIEGYYYGKSITDFQILVYLNSTAEDLADQQENIISDLYKFFNKDESIAEQYVSSLGTLPYVQNYVINETAPNLNGIQNSTVVGLLLKIEYINFIDSTPLPAPEVPILTSPVNEYSTGKVFQDFNWEEAENAVSYQIQISIGQGAFFDSGIVIDQNHLVNTSFTVPDDLPLSNFLNYFWRVRSNGLNEVSNWSDVWRFQVNDSSVVPLDPSEVGLTDIWVREDMTMAGSKVSSWNDKTGNGRHLTNATDANRPITETLSGKTFVKFEGTVSAVRNLSVIDSAHVFKMTGTQTRSFVWAIVTRANTVGSRNIIMSRSNNNVGDEFYFTQAGDSLNPTFGYYMFPKGLSSEGGNITIPKNNDTLQQFVLVVSGTNAKTYLNGNLISVFPISYNPNPNLPATASTFFVLGGGRQPNASQGTFAGSIGEFASGAVALTDSQVASLYEYHRQYYGL